jgi:hypothetical protein
MIGIVIPARDEESLLATCLRAALTAARDPALRGEPVCVVGEMKAHWFTRALCWLATIATCAALTAHVVLQLL